MEKTKIFNWVCVVLMGLIIVLQMLPFWKYDASLPGVAIQQYVWLIPDNMDVQEYLAPYVVVNGKHFINSVIGMPLLVLASGLVGIVLNLRNNNVYTTLLPLFCGAIGVWGYLALPAFQLGTAWVLHLIVCIALIAAAAVKIFFLMKEE